MSDNMSDNIDYSEYFMNYLVFGLAIMTVIVILIICKAIYDNIINYFDMYDNENNLDNTNNTEGFHNSSKVHPINSNRIAEFDATYVNGNNVKVNMLRSDMNTKLSADDIIDGDDSNVLERELIEKILKFKSDKDDDMNYELNRFIGKSNNEDLFNLLKTKYQCSDLDQIFINRVFNYELYTDELNYFRLNGKYSKIPLNASDYDTPLLNDVKGELGKDDTKVVNCKNGQCNVNSTNYYNYKDDLLDTGIFYVPDNTEFDITVNDLKNKPSRLLVRYSMAVIDNLDDILDGVAYKKNGEVLNKINDNDVNVKLITISNESEIKEKINDKIKQLSSLIMLENKMSMRHFNIELNDNITLFQVFYVDICFKIKNGVIEPYIFDVHILED